MKKLISLLQISVVLSLATPFITSAHNLTWTGSASGNWNDSANFSPMFVPTANDTVTIDAATHHPRLTSNASAYRLVLLDDTFDLNGYHLNIANEALFSGGWLVDGQLNCRGTIATFAGTVINAAVDVDCTTLELNGSVFNQSCYFKAETGESQGGNTFMAPVSLVHVGTAGESITMTMDQGDTFHDTLYVNNTSDGNIHLTQADTSYFENCLRMASTGTGSIHFGREGGISILETNGHLVVENGEFTAGQLFIKNIEQQNTTGHRMVLTGTGSSDGHSLLALENCNFSSDVDFTAPNLLLSRNRFEGTAQFTKTGGYDNVSTGDNLFSGDASFTNSSTTGHLLLTGSREDRFVGTAEFTSGSTKVIAGYGATAIFEGDVVVNSATVGFYRLKFTGEAEQTLSGTTGHIYGETELDKASGSVTATIPIAIDRRLTFTKGYLVTDSINLITFLPGASATDASDSSFISGPVKKVGNTAFEFPVGKDGHFRPVGISAPDSVADAFVGEYFAQGQEFSNVIDTIFDYINDCNYWYLDQVHGLSGVYVSLGWDSSYCHTFNRIMNLRVSFLDDSSWVDLGRDTLIGDFRKGMVFSSLTAFDHGYFTWAFERLAVPGCIGFPNPNANCVLELICNGGFEEGAQILSNPNTNLGGAFGFPNGPIGTLVTSWSDWFPGMSADLFVRGNTTMGIPLNSNTTCFDPNNGLDTWNGAANNNNRYAGMVASEGLVADLVAPIFPGEDYLLRFRAVVTPYCTCPVGFSTTAFLDVFGVPDVANNPMNQVLLGTITVSDPFVPTWDLYTLQINGQSTGGNPVFENLLIRTRIAVSECSNDTSDTIVIAYFLIDDVSLRTMRMASFAHDPACINQPVQFTCAVNDPAAQFQWSFGDGSTDNTQSPQHTYTEPGYYEVVLTVSIGNCVDCFRRVIYVSPSCCAVNPAVVTYLDQSQVPDVITTNTTWNTNMFSPLLFRLNRTITVAPDATLTIAASAVIEFGPEGRIVVDRRDVNNSNVGGRMIMETNSKLTSITNTITNCPVMWQGVEVWGHHDISHFPTNNQVNHGMLTMLGEAIIEHAHNGVILGRTQYPFGDGCNPPIDDVDYPPYDLTHSGGILIADAGANFLNNGIGIKFLPYRFKNASIIESSHFIGGTLLDDHYDSDNNPHYSLSVQPNHNPWYGEANPRGRSSIGIYNWGTRGLTFSLNRFENSQAGVESFDAQYNVDDNNTFYDHQYGVDINNTFSSSFNVVHVSDNNTFNNIIGDPVGYLYCTGFWINNAAIRIRGGRGNRIEMANAFGNPNHPTPSIEPIGSVGMQILSSDNTNIVDNYFGDLNLGIYTSGSFRTGGLIGFESLGNYFNSIHLWGILSLNGNPAMRIRCNHWNNMNSCPGIICWQNFNGQVPLKQGNPGFFHTRPAGNDWNEWNYLIDKDVSNIGNSNSFVYHHHDPQWPFLSVEPFALGNMINSNNGIPKGNTSCDPVPLTMAEVFSLKDSLEGVKDSLVLVKDSLWNIIINEPSVVLQNYISDSTVSSADLADTLIAYSPLSNAVLNSYFSREWGMEDSDFFEVMVHNLPVSDSVLSSYRTVLYSMTDTLLIDSLEILYADNPYYKTVFALARDLETCRLDRSALVNKIVVYYVENDSVSDLILLLEAEDDNLCKMDAVCTAFLSGNMGMADEIMGNIDIESTADQYWADIMEIAFTLDDLGLTWFSMDSTMIATVLNIAQIDTECTAKRNAQSIAKLVFGIDFNEGEFSDSTGLRIGNGDSGNHPVDHMTTGKSELYYYPNPADAAIFIKNPETEFTGNIKILDVTGKILLVVNLRPNTDIIEVDVSQLASGLYFISYQGNKSTLTEKIIISHQ